MPPSALRADLTRRALNQFVNDRINERLKSALGPDSPTVEASRPALPPPLTETAAADETRIVTTEDEKEGYLIVKAILREVVDPRRIAIRDAQSYCAVLLDDNNRKEKIPISDLQDFFQFGSRLKETVGFYGSK